MSVAPTGHSTPDRDLAATVRAAHLATRRVYFALVVVGLLEALSLTRAFVQWRRGGSFEPALIELLICAMGAVLLVGLFAVTRKFRIAAGSAVAAGDRLGAVEQELRDSNARYVRADRATGEGIWEWDIAGDTVYHSPMAREILGLEHEHIHRARAWFDSSLHPDDAARLGEVVGRALGAGGRYSVDFRLRGSDGRYRWIRSHAAATLDADGQPRWLSGSSKDIGDERQTRQDLSDLRIVLSDSPDGVARADEAGIVTLVNPACSAMLGFDPREMLGRDCRGFVHPDDLPRFQQALSDMETGGRAQCEVRALRSDGSAIELRLVLVCCRSLVGASTGHFCFMTDGTARNQAERALRLSEQQIRAVVEMQTEYICRWRPDGTLTFVNEAYCRCFGKAREELIGRSFVPLIPEEDQHVVARVLEGITADNPSVTIEHRVVVASGETRWHRWTDRGLFDAAGRIEEYQSVGIDITGQKQAEAELRASVQRFQTLAQLAPVGIFQSDERGRNTYVNESWCRLTGLSCEQGMEYGWKTAVHPDDRRRVEEEFFAAVKDNRDFASEFRYRRPDGSVVHATGRATALRDHDGRVLGYFGAVSDITARKHVEAELRTSVSRFQTLAQLAPVGIFQTNERGENTYVNGQIVELTGLTADQIRGVGWHAAIHPEDRERVIGGFSDATREGRDFSAEYRFLRPDGTPVHVVCATTMLRDGQGRTVGYLGAISNITELKQTEAELRASMQRFQTLAQLAPVGIFQTDEQGRCLFVNDRWCRLTGYSSAEASALGCCAPIHPEDVEHVTDGFHTALAAQRDYTREFRYLRRDGTVVSVIGAASVLHDDAGRFLGYLGAISDITALKAAEARIRDGLAYQQELARRERALRRELDHRVRNNLTSLLGLIRFYGRSGDPAAMAQVEGKVRAMGEIHDLLAATSGREVELAAIIRRLAELILGAEPARRVVIQSPRGAIPAARASALAMIVQELLTNSLKHGAMLAPAQPAAEPDAAAEPGTIEVNWQPRDDGEPGFRLSWCERRPGTAATTFQLTDSERPARDGDLWHAGGVGLSLIRGLANAELQGRCSFKIEPDGLRFELDAGVPLYTRDPDHPGSVLESPIELRKES